MINSCTRDAVSGLFKSNCPEHPLDQQIISQLKQLGECIREDDDDYELFRHRKETDDLWGTLLGKAIKCLRLFDVREPFLASKGDKKPKAYGIDELKDYYKKYTDFERVLYGANRYYRDHVIHVLRTWLSGIELMVKNNGAVLEHMAIHDKKIEIQLENEEKISIWTIVALTHDLGYPLQKAKSIIDITQNMLTSFITNPDISVDFSFHGVQNYMNDYIIRLMSSKMEERKESPASQKPLYVARLQSKYYFKFQKSLERNCHGILSTLIIYKLLTYFLESDYNLNEDYYFDKEDCRQFYIRREILRAIASHTCNDIYQMYMGSFSFLLRICDDTQEWGRKNISELYVKSKQDHQLQDIDLQFSDDPEKANHCWIMENITVPLKDNAISLIYRFREQSLIYITLFRDGQDTNLRDFSFARNLQLKVADITIDLKLEIDKDKASTLNGTVAFTSDADKNKPFGKTFFEELSKILGARCEYEFLDSAGESTKSGQPDSWHKAKFSIPLVN